MTPEPTRTIKTAGGERPTAPDGVSVGTADTLLRKLLPYSWPLFAVLWLSFPLASAADMVGSGLSPARLLAYLVWTAAYLAVYLWLVLRYPFRANRLSPWERRIRIALLAILAALALYLELWFASGVPYHFMFVVIAAAVTLSTRYATLTVLGIVFVGSGLYALRSGWEAVASNWEITVAPFVIVGVSLIVVSRLVVTVRELQAAREEIARLAVAEERLRFARDLHDLLGHSLSQIALKSELAARLLPATPEKAAAEVRDIEDVARKSLGEVREAVAGYRQPTLDGELEGAREMLQAAGISCWIENRAGALPNATDAVLGWAVREGVTNVIRHSRARCCEIRLAREGEEIHAEVSDDGLGSESEHDGASTGSGLSGLAERVAARGGDFEAGPLPEGGFRLRVSLPVGGSFAREDGRL